MAVRQVTSGLIFYPRGGSAQVIRYLRQALARDGWEVPLVTGSLGPEGEQSNAGTFFGDDQLTPMDYTSAVEAYREGRDPIAQPDPLHPSYEDRPAVPDRIFTAVSPELAGHLETSWQNLFQRIDIDDTDVFQLHHLTPQHAAVARLWPHKPIIGHLHGTEMKMLAKIRDLQEIADLLGTDLASMAALNEDDRFDLSPLSDEQRQIVASTNWPNWRYGDFWDTKLRQYASLCRRLIVISPYDQQLARRLFDVDRDDVVWIPNGVDTARFDRRDLSTEETIALLRQWLVDDPQGWDESGSPGTVRYTPEDLANFVDPDNERLRPVLLYVGRFLQFKRVPLLIRAYQRAREHFDIPVPLIIWGGSPGEWEGEHPYTVARSGGAHGIYFTGWRGHNDLPLGLNCADLMVAPSYNEPFGQVYLEAMASGLPVVATRSGGPLSFVNTDPDALNGWLIPPDDLDALTLTLIEAVNNPTERHRRAENAYQQSRRNYSWTNLAERFEDVYLGEIEAVPAND